VVKILYIGHFIINDGLKVDVNVPQLMHIVQFVIIILLFFFCNSQPKDKVEKRSNVLFQE
jgi:preprotein translocase subunit YajC